MLELIKKGIVYSVCVTMSVLPIHSYANATVENTGKEAKQIGLDMARLFKKNAVTKSGNNLSIKDPNSNSEYDVNIGDLFPGTSSTSSDGGYFPDDQSPDNELIGGTFNDDEAMGQIGSDSKNALWSDAHSQNPTISGAAYKVLVDASNRSRPDFSTDPLMNLSKDTYGNIDMIAEGFGDCHVVTSITDTSRPVHLPEYERCQKITQPSGDCTIQHSINVQSNISDVKVASKGREWLTVKFDLKSGSWSAISPSDGDQKVAEIPTVDFDEVCGGAVASKTTVVGSWDWTDHGISGPADSTVNYSVKQIPTCENDLIGIVQIHDTTSGGDNKFVLGGRFTFRIAKIKQDDWTTNECVKNAKIVADGFCTGSVNIVKGPSSDSECVIFGGVEICPGDSFYNALSESEIPGISKLTTEVSVSDVQCDFNKGEMGCWRDINGNEQCPYNDGDITNSCEELENNPGCGFISSTCVDGAEGQSGTCYLYEDTYDCGHDVSISSHGKSQEYYCSGEIKCMGDTCLDVSSEQSQDFAKATALLNTAQFMTQDMKCTDSASGDGGDGNVDIGCTAFSGKQSECKIAVGGIQDCCDTPVNVTMADYLLMLKHANKLGSAVWQLDNTYVNAAKGAYQALGESAAQTWSEITQPFASYIENISGAVDSFTSTVSEFTDQLVDMLKEQLEKVMNEILTRLGYEGGSAAAQGAAASAMDQIMSSGPAQFLGQVMTVYGYVALAIAAIKLIYKCEEEEFELNSKRELKSCHFIGSYCKTKAPGSLDCIEKRESYCCYSSPLSRIVQEQVRPQLGIGWGTSESPSCGGIPLDRINEVDWGKVNLDEWLGILQENGQLDNQTGLSIESLTGAGNALSIDNGRLDAKERTLRRLDGIDADKIRNDTAETLSSSVDKGQGGGG